ncbi:MAG: hypothetical protein JSV16_15445, partial [Candidatus Hydrogenedentota bacterium]
MTRKTTTITLIVCLGLCLSFLGALAALWWFVESGRLQTLIEARAAEMAGVKVRMKSLRLSWPIAVDVEEMTVAAIGHENVPLLACPRLKITSSLRDLLRGHLVSVGLVAPRINLVTDEGGSLNVPDLAFGKETDKSLSIGTIRIINGEINLDLPVARASLRGVLATLSEPIISVGERKVLRLNIDTARVFIGREDQRQVPVRLKLVQSKVSLHPKASAIEVEANMDALVTTEIPYLLLPADIPVGMSFAFDYSPYRDSLENAILTLAVPSFSDVRAYGSVTNLTSGAPNANLSLTVEAPEIADLLEYNELLQRPNYSDMEMAGNLRISGEIKGSLKDPKLSLLVNTRDARFKWRDLVLERLSVEMPVAVAADSFAMGPGRIKAATVFVPVSEARIQVAPLSSLVSVDPSTVSVEELAGKLGNVGEFSIRGNYEFHSGLFHANARMDGASVAEALAVVSQTIYKPWDYLTAAGTLELDCDFEGRLAPTMEKLKVKYGVSLKDGEISSGEFMSAAGINARLSGNVGTDSPRRAWKFDTNGYVGNFEILVDTFYKAFSESTFPFSFSGEYLIEEKRFENTSASLNLGQAGEIVARGNARLAPTLDIAMRLKSDKIDLGQLSGEIGEELLSEMSPFLRGAEIGGVTSGSVAVQVQDNRWEADGAIMLADGRFVLNQGIFSIGPVSANLPVGIHSFQEEQDEPIRFTEKDDGRITCGRLNIGPVATPSLALDVALKKNALHVKGPISTSLFQGKLSFGDIRGENLFGPSARLVASL